MGLHCIISPASSGKTTWVVDQARKASLGLLQKPRIVVPSLVLVEDIQRRLASSGGALGVWVGTLGDLAEDVLAENGDFTVSLSELLQRELLKDLVQEMELAYFGQIKDKPGFIFQIQEVIRELKAGGISPEDFIEAVERIQAGRRLIELGWIYQRYQAVLRDRGWSDPAGQLWLALERLRNRPHLCESWGPIYLDGFDDLSPVQADLVLALAEQVRECTFTLTGVVQGPPRELVHKRFIRLGEQLLAGNDTNVDALETQYDPVSAGLKKMEGCLFREQQNREISVGSDLEMYAVPDREAEVRTALRWLRQKIAGGEIQPGESAVLMRSLEPYRALVEQISREFQMPVRILGGIPLLDNPAVNAIWKLVQCAGAGREGLAWQDLISLWRSPYFSWECISHHPGGAYDREAHLAETRSLEEVARWGRVIRGYDQWEEAFGLLAAQDNQQASPQIGEEGVPGGLPTGHRAAALWNKFESFVGLIEEPRDLSQIASFAAWILKLLGDPQEDERDGSGLGILQGIMNGPQELAERDWQAVSTLVSLIKQLTAAESLFGREAVQFSDFAAELGALLERASYQPARADGAEILCADCTQSRGLTYQAVALLGLSEGEFPGTIREDPFLRDSDRFILHSLCRLPLRQSTDSAEAEYFYEAVTRATHWLLLTRPRIAENGAPSEKSPYWEEVERLVDITPRLLTTQSQIPLELAASQAEYLEFLAAQNVLDAGVSQAGDEQLTSALKRIQQARKILQLRTGQTSVYPSRYEGGLGMLAEILEVEFDDSVVWSASRLEKYQTCPFNFFIGSLLAFEMLEPPAEGLDGRQLGSIYHQILEDLYNKVGRQYSLTDLLDALALVADAVFEKAPQKEGFRETAWWDQTQVEILDNLRLSLTVIEGLSPEFRFHSAEHRFGFGYTGQPSLVVEAPEGGRFRLRGLIDRVDRSPDGSLRIIDYKTAGPSGYDARSVREGKKLQLPLYALAAEKLLGLGSVTEGFYFHLQAASPSSFQLSKFKMEGGTGPGAAMQAASRASMSAIRSIRKGDFSPRPPEEGCPSYCPAVGFCWKYQPRYW